MPENDHNSAIDTIELIDHYKPRLASGDYTLKASLSIDSKAGVHKDYQFSDGSDPHQTFSVLGPRFKLSPKDINSTYPPQGSSGDHYASVLPHIVLNRVTLPWERTPDLVIRSPTDLEHPSWLALLLVSEDEEDELEAFAGAEASMGPRIHKGTLEQLKGYTDKSFFPLKPESGDHDKDELNVIKIKKAFLQNIAPTLSELRLLAHVRCQENADANANAKHAVVVCNRLPKPNMRNTVYLVSMEGRYSSGDIDLSEADEWVRLVTLKAWQFTCIDDDRGAGFCELLKNLNSGVLRLSENANPDAERYLGMGYIPLRHYDDNGKQDIAWYHGPFVSGLVDNQATLSEDAQLLENLVRPDSRLGISDYGYAAAWELGRLLTLQNKKASLALFQWKRHHHQQSCHQEVCDEIAHLPCQMRERQYDFPLEWFERLAQLEGIPFNYLVPDEKMLPSESIRFFRVDPRWIQCLLDGAYSIGSTTEQECRYFASQKPYQLNTKRQPVSGFLLRSDAVSGWPELNITGLRKEAHKLDNNLVEISPARDAQYLSKNILLSLFTDTVEAVEISPPPQTLHFSISKERANLKSLVKKEKVTKPSVLASLLLADTDKVKFSMSGSD